MATRFNLRTTIWTILLLSSILDATAQKNRPVMKDATILMDVLTQDYSTTDDPEQRNSKLQNDRSSVVAILNAYAIKLNSAVADRTELDRLQLEVTSKRHEISLMNSTKKPADTTEVGKLMRELRRLQKTVQDDIDSQEAILFDRDIKILKGLREHFNDTGNTFLTKVVDKFISKFEVINANEPDTLASVDRNVQTQKGLGIFSSGGLTLTNAIDGLAMFMAKRIKEELAAQIFDKIKTALSDTSSVNDKFAELKIVLPRTTQLLKTVSPEQYQGIINTLKETIEKDIDNLIVNIPHLDQSKRVRDFFKNHPEAELALTGVQLINDLNKVKSPTEAIFVFEDSKLIRKWSTEQVHANFVNGVKLASLLVYSITEDVSDRRRFIPVEEWESFYKDITFYNLFTGLLLQQDTKYYNIRFGSNSFKTLLVAGVNNMDQWYELLIPSVKDLLRQASSIEEQLDGLKAISATGAKLPVDSVAQLLRSSITFLDSTISVSDAIMKKLTTGVDFRVKSTMYFSFARHAVDMYADLGKKRYYNATSDAAVLFGDIQNQTHVLKKDSYLEVAIQLNSYKKALEDLERRLTSDAVINAQNVLRNIQPNCTTCPGVAAVMGLTGNASFGDISTAWNLLKNDAQTGALNLPILLWLDAIFRQDLAEKGLTLQDIPKPDRTIVSQAQLYQYFNQLVYNIDVQLKKDPEVIKVVNFITAVCKAESAEDFSAAIEAIALPAGSAIIKRESAWNISLNGYAGFFGGIEQIRETGSQATNFAFTVPIGVAISRSFGRPCDGPSQDCKKSGSWSLFFSAIDIGAFTSVRFRGNDQALPEIKFNNIIAPGIQLIYGIPKSSFAIAGGIQYGPFLRKVEDTATPAQDFSERDAFRFGISLLIDIPLINFYTKSKGLK